MYIIQCKLEYRNNLGKYWTHSRLVVVLYSRFVHWFSVCAQADDLTMYTLANNRPAACSTVIDDELT